MLLARLPEVHLSVAFTVQEDSPTVTPQELPRGASSPVPITVIIDHDITAPGDRRPKRLETLSNGFIPISVDMKERNGAGGI
jgi:hypothetical protein